MPAQPLTIEVAQEDDAVVFRLAGELDAGTAPTLQAAIDALDPGAGRVVLDCSCLRFLDSSGLNLLLTVHQALAVQLREMVVRHVHGAPLRVLQVSGLDLVLHLR